MANLKQTSASQEIVVQNQVSVNGNQSINVNDAPFTVNEVETDNLTVANKITQSGFSVPVTLASGTLGSDVIGPSGRGTDLLDINFTLDRPMTVICEACFSTRPGVSTTTYIYLRQFLNNTVLSSVNMPNNSANTHIRTLTFSGSRDNVPAGICNWRFQVYALGQSPIRIGGAGSNAITYIIKGVF